MIRRTQETAYQRACRKTDFWLRVVVALWVLAATLWVTVAVLRLALT